MGGDEIMPCEVARPALPMLERRPTLALRLASPEDKDDSIDDVRSDRPGGRGIDPLASLLFPRDKDMLQATCALLVLSCR
jgi:hypothetical protein